MTSPYYSAHYNHSAPQNRPTMVRGESPNRPSYRGASPTHLSSSPSSHAFAPFHASSSAHNDSSRSMTQSPRFPTSPAPSFAHPHSLTHSSLGGGGGGGTSQAYNVTPHSHLRPSPQSLPIYSAARASPSFAARSPQPQYGHSDRPILQYPANNYAESDSSSLSSAPYDRSGNNAFLFASPSVYSEEQLYQNPSATHLLLSPSPGLHSANGLATTMSPSSGDLGSFSGSLDGSWVDRRWNNTPRDGIPTEDLAGRSTNAGDIHVDRHSSHSHKRESSGAAMRSQHHRYQQNSQGAGGESTDAEWRSSAEDAQQRNVLPARPNVWTGVRQPKWRTKEEFLQAHDGQAKITKKDDKWQCSCGKSYTRKDSAVRHANWTMNYCDKGCISIDKDGNQSPLKFVREDALRRHYRDRHGEAYDAQYYE